MSPKGLAYVGRRLALAIPTLLTIVLLNFALLHLAPGDAADVLAGEAGSATPEYMAQLRQKFGLDQPVQRLQQAWIGVAPPLGAVVLADAAAFYKRPDRVEKADLLAFLRVL